MYSVLRVDNPKKSTKVSIISRLFSSLKLVTSDMYLLFAILYLIFLATLIFMHILNYKQGRDKT